MVASTNAIPINNERNNPLCFFFFNFSLSNIMLNGKNLPYH